MSTTCTRITRREQKIARTRANKLLHDMQKELEGTYKMTFRIAGSGCWGTMVKDPEGKYDLDYQIIITKNSKDYEKSVIKKPRHVKDTIRSAFDTLRNKGESFENSTTAITLVNKNESVPYSIDFVILTEIDGRMNIIKQNKHVNSPTYTWNQLPQHYTESYSYFKGLGPEEKKEIIDKVIVRKCKEKYHSDSNISSSEILIQEINNYRRNHS